MRRIKPLSFALAVIIFVAVEVFAAEPVYIEKNIMVNQNSGMSSLTATATYCMGRFLINVPAGSLLTGGNYKYDFIAISSVKAISFEDFEKEVAMREQELKNAKNEKTKQAMLLQSAQSGRGGKILVSWKADYSTALVNIDGYRWINGNRFQFQLDVGNGKQESGMKRVQEALTRLRPRADNDIPIEPGYCSRGASSPMPSGKMKKLV